MSYVPLYQISGPAGSGDGDSGSAAITQSAQLFVDTAGDDGTGTRGRLDLPYATVGAALADAQAGDTIHIGAGSFAGNLTISLDNLTLRGAGMAATTITYTTTQVGLTLAQDVVNFSISDLKLDGQRDPSVEVSGYGNTQGIGVLLTGANAFTRLERVWVYRASGHAVFGADGSGNTGSSDVSILRCRIEGLAITNGGLAKEQRYGILDFRGDRWLVSENYITGMCQAVGLWTGVLQCTVSHNKIVDNWGEIGTGGGGTRSACEDYSNGVAAPDHGQNVWFDNYVDGTTNAGFEIAQGVVGSHYIANKTANCLGGHIVVTSDGTTPTTDLIIRDNRCYGPGAGTAQTCIQLNGASLARVRIETNLIANFLNNTASIYVAAGTEIVVTGNIISGCTKGVLLDGVGDAVLVAGNTIDGIVSGERAIDLVTGNWHRVLENTIIDTGAVASLGINVAGSYHTIAGNFIECVNRGIVVPGSDCLLEANSIKAAGGGNDACLHLTGNRNTARLNQLYQTGGGRAIYLSGTATGNMGSDNRLLVSGNFVYDQSTGSNILNPTPAFGGFISGTGTQVIALVRAVNLNSASPTDTVIPINDDAGGPTNIVRVTGLMLTNASTSLGASAVAGTVRDATGGGGNEIVAALAFTDLTGATKFKAQTLASFATTDVIVSGRLVVRLTTAHGSAATCDVYVMGEILK